MIKPVNAHPARYSKELLPIFARVLSDKKRILDPFSGTGERLKAIFPCAFLNELEPEWTAITPERAICGDALALAFKSNSFDAVATSPTYGNRMADDFEDRKPEKKYKRNTYRHVLGRKLSPNNTGAMQWGAKYRTAHESAWREVWRVLSPGGVFVLNISDHMRGKKRAKVAAWHFRTVRALGFQLVEAHSIKTKRNRQGQNGGARVKCEFVFVFKK